MKYAITGKGGVGKSTIAGLLAHYFAKSGKHVLAVDADPDANLASAIGISKEQALSVVPISEQRALIKERTGANPREFGQLFKINPVVNDIPDEFCIDFRGIKLLVMGAVKKGGNGCACPENVLLRSLLSEIMLNRDEVVIVDMEAGIEHLGRATAGNVDKMLIVVEPGQRSVDTANSIIKLGQEIGIRNFAIIANKVQNPEQESWIKKSFSDNLLIGMLSYNETIRESDILQKPLIDSMDEKLKREFAGIFNAIN
jgi:CO dehydrogenase maturation factor